MCSSQSPAAIADCTSIKMMDSHRDAVPSDTKGARIAADDTTPAAVLPALLMYVSVLEPAGASVIVLISLCAREGRHNSESLRTPPPPSSSRRIGRCSKELLTSPLSSSNWGTLISIRDSADSRSTEGTCEKLPEPETVRIRRSRMRPAMPL